MQELGLQTSIPIAGFYSFGAFGQVDGLASLMETDSMYALITSGPVDSKLPSALDLLVESESEDVMTAMEKKYFNDEDEAVVITKRDAESAAAGQTF